MKLRLSRIGMMLGITAAILVAIKYPTLGMGIWIFGNGALMVHNYKAKDWDQYTLYLVYEVINIVGIIYWWIGWEL